MGGSLGPALALVITVDAVLVLSGAVLTSYVGVTGLLRRMTLDRVMPQLLLKRNKRGTTHRIIVGFFILAVSVLLITQGELEALAGVYTISFLAVMALFGIGNILLKVRRERLPRPTRATWPALLIAIVAVLLGLAGNIIRNPEYFRVFLYYFVPSVVVIMFMLGRIGILKALLYFVRRISETVAGFTNRTATSIRQRIDDINSQQVVFFTRGDSIDNLNQAMLYVRENEHTSRIKVVTIVQDESEIPDRLATDLQFLDEAYPDIDIEFLVEKGEFGPKIIQTLSKKWNIPANFMFIASPGDHFLYGLAELGGVRLII